MLHNATVTFDPKAISTAALVESIRQTGYGAEMPVVDESVLEEQEKHDEEQMLEYKQLRLEGGGEPDCRQCGDGAVHAVDEHE